MKELRFSQRCTSPPLVCHRRHRISAQPLSPEPEPVSSDLLVKGSPKQMIKSHATASLSELDPNLIHGESEHSREDKSYSMSPMLDRRKRPRTIRDYFSLPNWFPLPNLYNNFGLPDSSRCHLIHWQRWPNLNLEDYVVYICGILRYSLVPRNTSTVNSRQQVERCIWYASESRTSHSWRCTITIHNDECLLLYTKCSAFAMSTIYQILRGHWEKSPISQDARSNYVLGISRVDGEPINIINPVLHA